MQASFSISASTGRYDVSISPGLLDKAVNNSGDAVFIADAFFAERLRAVGIDPICLVADEHSKALDKMVDVIVALRERQASRETRIIAVGGGVVQDVAAFAASVYMRGVDWVYVPTTLLSMADSCIGGKSSINVGKYKNIVGTFHPPSEIWVDPLLTDTLTAEQRAAGLCEAAKITLCRGVDCFEAYERLKPHIACDDRQLADVVGLALQAKKWFIEIDEFDRAERLTLNFGHTFGHALEAASAFRVSHGIAVGVGMLAAINLGIAMGRNYNRMPHVGRFVDHIRTLLKAVEGLNDTIADLSVDRLLDAFNSDKKHSRAHFAVIAINEDGVPERFLLPRNASSTALVTEAFLSTLAEPMFAPG